MERKLSCFVRYGLIAAALHLSTLESELEPLQSPHTVMKCGVLEYRTRTFLISPKIDTLYQVTAHIHHSAGCVQGCLCPHVQCAGMPLSLSVIVLQGGDSRPVLLMAVDLWRDGGMDGGIAAVGNGCPRCEGQDKVSQTMEVCPSTHCWDPSFLTSLTVSRQRGATWRSHCYVSAAASNAESRDSSLHLFLPTRAHPRPRNASAVILKLQSATVIQLLNQ